MKNSFILFSLLCLVAYTECYAPEGLYNPLRRLLKAQNQKPRQRYNSASKTNYVGNQEGRKEADKIEKLPGQPPHVNFSQYSGHVTVDPNAGRALFYYLAEAENPTDKPLVLWLNGGPGCSSMGAGAMTELGPFRVKPDGKTLRYNKYAWNTVANVLFLESPAGVGFSYSKRLSDYVTGDVQTAADSYTFLANWFERFAEYKGRDFFIAGESYAGHYVPQLADLILKNTNNTAIRLKGIALGNAVINDADLNAGAYDFWWTHALISDETHKGIIINCNFSSEANVTETCQDYKDTAHMEIGPIDHNNIYAPLCNINSSSATTPSSGMPSFDPCSLSYVHTYLNKKKVQTALHANASGITRPWQVCRNGINMNWTDSPATVLPVINNLMESGIRVWIFSGDTDGAVPVTATKYSLPKLTTPRAIKSPWSPWYCQAEVGGYAIEYEKLTFSTIRASGHMVPSYQQERALTFFASFLQGKLPTSLN